MPFGIEGFFAPLSAAVFLLLAVAFMRVGRGLGRMIFVFAAWLILTGVLARVGFFANFQSMPPRLPIFVVIQFVFLTWFVCFSKYRDGLLGIPQTFLIGAQVFRVPVELLLANLAARGLLPVEMSFHGRNFDIVTGASALVAAFLVWRRGEWVSRRLILAWNAMGLVLVTIVVAHGLLSVPYPFQVLHLSVDNRAVAEFPAIWLPLFLVPVAYLLHFASIAKAWRQGAR